MNNCVVYLFAVKDTKIGYHNPPFLAANGFEAKHVTKQSLTHVPEAERVTLDDLCLVQIGTYDMNTGIVAPDYQEVCSIISLVGD